MATKARKLPAKVLTPEETESLEKGKAKLTLSNSLNAAAVIELYGKSVFGELRGATDLVCEELNDSIAKLGNGDMTNCEGMLLAQASALQSIFVNLTRRAIHQEGLSQFDTFLRLGLKAQAQAVRTIEALGELKNPRSVAFVKQANIANGPQQVNNGEAPRAGENGNQQSKLLEVQHGNYLDGGTTQATSGTDPELATVGEINRTEVRRGQGQGSAEQL